MRKQAPTVTSKIGYKKKGHVLINSLQEKKTKASTEAKIRRNVPFSGIPSSWRDKFYKQWETALQAARFMQVSRNGGGNQESFLGLQKAMHGGCHVLHFDPFQP